jgi:hypothetical protein
VRLTVKPEPPDFLTFFHFYACAYEKTTDGSAAESRKATVQVCYACHHFFPCDLIGPDRRPANQIYETVTESERTFVLAASR